MFIVTKKSMEEDMDIKIIWLTKYKELREGSNRR